MCLNSNATVYKLFYDPVLLLCAVSSELKYADSGAQRYGLKIKEIWLNRKAASLF